MRIDSYIKRYGFCGIAENLILKSFRLFGYGNFQIMRLLRFDMSKLNTPISNNYVFMQLTWNDFVHCRHNDLDRYSEALISQIEKRFEEARQRGELCYGIVENDTILAYAWISLNYYPRSNGKLPSESAFIYDDYTHPNYRGHGLHKQLIEYRLYVLEKLGYKRVYASVDLFNKASLKGFLRAGFMECSKYNMWVNRKGQVKSTIKIMCL